MKSEGEIDFDEAWYVAQYPDVRAGINTGRIKSAHQHFQTHGYKERRLPRRPAVDEGWYLATYPDVAAALCDGKVTSAFDHFVHHGYAEGRAPNPRSE